MTFNGKTVAVVGNSDAWINKKNVSRGEEIDSNEIVCRFNFGINTQMNHECLGSKCDVAFLNNSRLLYSKIDGLENAHVVHTSLKFREDAMCDEMIPEECVHEVSKLAGVDRPTSGLIAIHWIHSLGAKKILLYAFDFGKSKSWYHTRKDDNSPHDFLNEERFVKSGYYENLFIQ